MKEGLNIIVLSSVVSPGEVEEPIAVDEKSEQNMLKKDIEKIGDVRTGMIITPSL